MKTVAVPASWSAAGRRGYARGTMGAHEPTRSRPAFRAASITLAGLAVATAFALVAEGFYHEDDIEHVLIARDAWGSVDKMLHWWGRPGFTIPAMFADRPPWCDRLPVCSPWP
jgi:hypothetical protein